MPYPKCIHCGKETTIFMDGQWQCRECIYSKDKEKRDDIK